MARKARPGEPGRVSFCQQLDEGSKLADGWDEPPAASCQRLSAQPIIPRHELQILLKQAALLLRNLPGPSGEEQQLFRRREGKGYDPEPA